MNCAIISEKRYHDIPKRSYNKHALKAFINKCNRLEKSLDPSGLNQCYKMTPKSKIRLKPRLYKCIVNVNVFHLS